MLQDKKISPGVLELLKSLMELPPINDFFLVGGTAIALHLGHRVSIDLDLFIKTDFDSAKLISYLNEKYNITSSNTDINTLSTLIKFKEDNVKVEFLSYKYKLLKPVKKADGIRLLELEDLIPMKLSAIAGRGAKKDFCDIYFLLEKFPLTQMLELFKKKYEPENTFHLLKSLTFFDDAELEPELKLFRHIDWQEVKNKIVKEVSNIL